MLRHDSTKCFELFVWVGAARNTGMNEKKIQTHKLLLKNEKNNFFQIFDKKFVTLGRRRFRAKATDQIRLCPAYADAIRWGDNRDTLAGHWPSAGHWFPGGVNCSGITGGCVNCCRQ